MRIIRPIALLALIVGLAGLPLQSASAAGVTGFNAGRIIDDIVMTNSSSMSVSQIQSFLNSKVSSCDTNGQQLSEFGGPDLNGDGKVQRWEWGKSKYNQTTFPCLKDYTTGGKKAAQIIYDKAQKYSINPQVLIVLLQKEQSLVTDTWPLNIQYKTATGYGCPDTAPCDSQYYGLANQIDWAAKLFHSVITQDPNWYSPYVKGNNFIRWSPNSSCGGSTVNVQNWSTAALYNYTPYQPNAAALNAGWGTGNNCSAYGNRNFYSYFTSWFGSTQITVKGGIKTRYDQLGGTKSSLGKAVANEVQMSSTSWYQQFQNGYIIGSSSSNFWESLGKLRSRWAQLGYQTGAMGYPTGAITTTGDGKASWQPYQNGYIIWSSSTGAWESMGTLRSRWAQLGYQTGAMGYPTSAITTTGDGKASWQEYQNGFLIWSESTGTWESKGSIRSRWAQLGYQTGALGYPTGAETYQNGVWSQTYQNGAIIGNGKTGFWESTGPIRSRWAQLGSTTGALGVPKSGITVTKDSKASWQEYQNGFIVWSQNNGAWESKGALRKHWATIGYQTGVAGFPTGPESYNASTSTWSQTYEHGTIYYRDGGTSWFTAT